MCGWKVQMGGRNDRGRLNEKETRLGAWRLRINVAESSTDITG